MKQFFKELCLSGLSFRHKLIVCYFIVSLFLVCSVVEAPVWGIVFIAGNFANAARLIKQVPIQEDTIKEK